MCVCACARVGCCGTRSRRSVSTKKLSCCRRSTASSGCSEDADACARGLQPVSARSVWLANVVTSSTKTQPPTRT
eukprot:2979281-Prymnesium_polylepis.1